jgi:anti-anti-sigma factor
VFVSYLTRWFARPAEAAARGECPLVVARAVPPPRAVRPSATVPAVEVAVSQTADGLVIRVKGEARVDCAGALLEGLLAAAARRPAVVTLDLSELRCLSSLAMGVLVAYRRGVVRAGGRVRLAERLHPTVRGALTRAELFDLFETASDAGSPPNHPAGPTPQQHSSKLMAV